MISMVSCIYIPVLWRTHSLSAVSHEEDVFFRVFKEENSVVEQLGGSHQMWVSEVCAITLRRLPDWAWLAALIRWWRCTRPARMMSCCVCKEASWALIRIGWASWWEHWWTISHGQFHEWNRPPETMFLNTSRKIRGSPEPGFGLASGYRWLHHRDTDSAPLWATGPRPWFGCSSEVSWDKQEVSEHVWGADKGAPHPCEESHACHWWGVVGVGGSQWDLC